MDNVKLVCRVLNQLGLNCDVNINADGTGDVNVYDGLVWLGTISFVGGELVDWA